MEVMQDMSLLHEKMNMHYLGLVADYGKERREMIKYLAAIAGGAAALAPQFFEHVKQTSFFYTGIGFLCLVVIISTTYVLSTIENDISKLVDDLQSKNKMFVRLRNPKIEFLKSDHDLESFKTALSGDIEEIPKEEKTEAVKWYKPMDYLGEFMVLFTITGLFLLATSLTGLVVSWKYIVALMFFVFLTINIISSFPKNVFMILGSPVDLIKSVVRLMFRQKR